MITSESQNVACLKKKLSHFFHVTLHLFQIPVTMDLVTHLTLIFHVWRLHIFSPYEQISAFLSLWHCQTNSKANHSPSGVTLWLSATPYWIAPFFGWKNYHHISSFLAAVFSMLYINTTTTDSMHQLCFLYVLNYPVIYSRSNRESGSKYARKCVHLSKIENSSWQQSRTCITLCIMKHYANLMSK